MNENKIAEELLGSLLRYEECVRRGQISADRNEPESGDELTLACVALRELEAAIPRRASDRPSWVPENIGRFIIKSVLGSGGFAVVYLARDPVLGRQVALKVPRPHTLMNPLLRHRFVAEAQTVARLQHPHIVTVFEAGEADDLPYMASAYCSGPTLSQWLSREAPVSGVVAARIVHALAGAVQYSHDNAVLHRDIKPDNVMLFPDDQSTTRDFPFCPRLGDFGLAKILDDEANASLTSQLIGTPRYMAPEVILGGGKVATAASDVYGLGALLYTLLTGQPPFSSASTVDTLKRVCEADPMPPHVFDPAISKDVSLICLKCMEKSPSRRYTSARELGDDLGRFLSGLPVTARAASLPLRTSKWCRRHPLGTTSLLATGVFLSLTLIGLRQHFRSLNTALKQTEIARHEAVRHQHLAEEHVFVTGLRLADSLRSEGDLLGAARIIDRYTGKQMSAGSIDPERHFAWRYLNSLVNIKGHELEGMDQAVWKMKISPDGNQLAICGSGGVVRVTDVHQNYSTLVESKVAQTELNGLAWCDVLPLLATSGDDGVVRVCDAKTLHVIRELPAFENQLAYDVVFLPGSSQLLVSGEASVIEIWDAATGEWLQSIETPHDNIETLELSPDGRMFCTGGFEGNLCMWSLADFHSVWTQSVRRDESVGPIRHVQFTADGTFVVASAMSDRLMVFRSTDGSRLCEWPGFTVIRGLDIENQKIFAAEDSGTLTELAIAEEGRRLEVVQQWVGHKKRVSALCLSRTWRGNGPSTELVTADRSGRIVVWPAKMPHTSVISAFALEQDYPTGNAACWIDHETLLCQQASGFVELNVRTGKHRIATEFVVDSPVTCFIFDQKRRRLMWGNHRGELVICDESGMQEKRITVCADSGLYQLSLDRDGAKLVARNFAKQVALVDLLNGDVLARTERFETAIITPNGKWICLGNWDDPPYFQICDARTLAPLISETRQEFGHITATITADGQHYVSRCNDGSLRVWNCPQGNLVHQLSMGIGAAHSLAIHPDCRTLVTLDDRSQNFTLWDLVTGSEILVGGKHSLCTRHVSFSNNGQFLVSTDRSGVVYVEDAFGRADSQQVRASDSR